MILSSALLGIMVGLAGHRTDRLFEYMERQNTPRAWWLTSRYGTGVLLGVFVFFMSVLRKPWRDEAAGKAILSFVFVGVGTIAGHMLDDLMDGKE